MVRLAVEVSNVDAMLSRVSSSLWGGCSTVASL